MKSESMLTREMKREALSTFRMDGGGDPWGEGMSHFFGVAEVLYHADQDLPERWQFRHGQSRYCNPIEAFVAHSNHDPEDEESCDCSGMWPDTEYVPFLDAGPLGVAMLTYAGNVFDRYLGFVKRAGRDY